nr:unnamed protein product [Callosobruchus chinensis]
MDLLNEILTVIAKEKLFSPQLVIDAIGGGNANITLGHIRSYITNEIQQEQKVTKEISQLTTNYRRDTDKLKEHLEELKNGVIEIRGSRCAACHHPLELPKIHFLCKHSFHQHCFQSFSDDEIKCPTCEPQNKDLLELLSAREYNRDLHETFHSQLEKAHDGFSVAAEYFGRGVFNKYKVITDETLDKNISVPMMNPSKPTVHKNDPESKNYGMGAEARLRQTEVKSKPGPVPISEGRIRLQEQRYSSSLEANMTHHSKSVEKRSVHVPQNPFEEAYDESKNPFCEDDDDLDETNPFREDLIHDRNLNHFS